MECPCNTCEKADKCPNIYICDELKTWVVNRKRKKPDKKDILVTNEEKKE